MAQPVRRFSLLLVLVLCAAVGVFVLTGGRAQAYEGMPREYRAYWSWVSTFNQQEDVGVEEGLSLLDRYPDLQPLYLRLASVCSPQERVACEQAIRQAMPEKPLTIGYQQAALALLADSAGAALRWARLAQETTLALPVVRLVVEHGAGSLGIDAARTRWEQRLAADSSDVAASFGLALLDIGATRLPSAKAHLQRALRAAPAQPELYRELGRVYFLTGDEALSETLLKGIDAAEAQHDYEGVLLLRGNLALALMRRETDLELAESLLDDALAQSRQLADANRIALNFYRLGQLRVLQVRYQDALALLDSATVYAPEDAATLRTQTMALRGTAEWALFRFSDAQQSLATARQQAREGAMVIEDIQASISLVQLYYRMGRYGEAQDLGIETLQTATRYDIAYAIVALHLALGDIANASGALDQAVAQYRLAIKVAQDTNMPERVQQASIRLAQVMLDLKDPAAASDYLEHAMSETDGSARVYEGLGRLYFAHGNYQKALEYYDAGIRRVGTNASLEATLYTNEAWVYITLEDFDKARNALTRARTALRQSGGNPQVAFFAESATAAMLYDSGAYEQALAMYQNTVAQARELEMPTYQWQPLHGMALSAWRMGQTALAEESFRNAISVIEALRDNLNDGTRRSSFIQDKVLVYKNFSAFLNEQGRTDEAFHFAERVRSRGLADLFTTALGTRDFNPDNPEMQLVEARRRQQALSSDLEDVASADEATPTDALRASQLRRELLRADSLYRTSFETVSHAGGMFTALAKPVRVEDVQPVLRSGEAIVMYTVASEPQRQNQNEVRAYVVTRDTAQSVLLPIGAEDLRRSISVFRDQISASNKGPGQGWEPTSRRLYDALMAPVVAVLPPQVTHLNLIPEGEMHYLPFAALRDARRRFVVERYSLSATPSASIFRLARQRGQENKGRWRQVVALADPTGKLPGTRREVRAIQAIKAIRVHDLVGARATEENLKLFAPTADILHFATHGYFNSRAPWSSALELYGSNLSVAEIGQVGLDRPYLVVLSACETALQSGTLTDVPQGDEWVGMNQAFMAAGAPSVMSSLWPISDRASSKLVSQFYNALLDTESKANALAQVQRAFIKDASFSHPYYWAAFTLTGDPL